MNIHILYSERSYHNLTIINGLERLKQNNSIYYLVGTVKDREKYQSLCSDTLEKLVFISPCLFLLKFLFLFYKRSSKFYFHGFYKLIFVLNCILCGFSLRRNGTWICWGSGLNKSSNHRFNIIFEFVKRIIYSSFEHVGVLMFPDAQRLSEILKIDVDKISVVPYIQEFPLFKKEKPNDGYINVLIGNHADPYHEHEKHLYALKRLSNSHKIKVILFLNYSVIDKDYVNRVVELAEKLFPGRNECYLDVLSNQDYQFVIKKVNLLIISVKWQTGLGAIYNVISSSGCVMLDDEGFNKRWLDYIGIHTLSLKSLQADELQLLPEALISSNVDIFNEFFDPDRVRKCWMKLLKLSEKKHNDFVR
ncbi:TDP-N-acetylfucosamine:lipid II N-acetylfucosaminyltransferase [Vibrio metschnikovii]|uniref:TDP-N-acetylfucosamine:lipid II N-acetylfucosaminyltransferase n=1 Tax=Vibrio metschnikovii TaxID=28172 RepID=UPI001C2F17A5|nr:TDP-N-acetylfucosamine:lipid II N-acetylfucosaminyltransferase [Vibrio metschnikovii]